MNMPGCEMKHKHTFALQSFLPAAFGTETEQATVSSSFLNCHSWIHQKSSASVLILNLVVTVPNWEGTIPNYIISRVKQNRYLPLAFLTEVFCVRQYPVLFFHQCFLWIIENFQKKRSLLKQIKIRSVFALQRSSAACFLLSAQPLKHTDTLSTTTDSSKWTGDLLWQYFCYQTSGCTFLFTGCLIHCQQFPASGNIHPSGWLTAVWL